MKELMNAPELRKMANEVDKFTSAIASEISEISGDRKPRQLETEAIFSKENSMQESLLSRRRPETR